MLAELATVVTLHCSTQMVERGATKHIELTATFDYDRNYAYVKSDGIGGLVGVSEFETSNLEVNPGTITFPRQKVGAANMTAGTINRTNGRLHWVFQSPLFYPANFIAVSGTCRPGDLVEPPAPVF